MAFRKPTSQVPHRAARRCRVEVKSRGVLEIKIRRNSVVLRCLRKTIVVDQWLMMKKIGVGYIAVMVKIWYN